MRKGYKRGGLSHFSLAGVRPQHRHHTHPTGDADDPAPHAAKARLKDNSFLVGRVNGGRMAVISVSCQVGVMTMLRAHTGQREMT